MARKLPWLLIDENTRVNENLTPRKRVKRELDPDTTPKQEPTSHDKNDFLRSSQTPPTSPARPCPPEEFLIAGFDKDDGWVMVEDEFYAVAQSFTQHLHYAEYLKRKKEAKAKATETLVDIERPTDGRTSTSKEQEMRTKADAPVELQKAGLEQINQADDNNDDDEEGDGDKRWAGTQLHGLMTSPHRVKSLAGAHLVRSSTRAAAGFGQTNSSQAGSSRAKRGVIHTSPSPSRPPRSAESRKIVLNEEMASEDDDLDGPAQSTPVPVRHQGNLRQRGPDDELQFSTSRSLEIPIKRSQKPLPKYKSKVKMLFDDLDEGLPEPQSSKLLSNEKEPNSRFNTVPTFLG